MGGTYGVRCLGSSNELMANGDVWSGPNDSRGWRCARGRFGEDGLSEYCYGIVDGKT